MSKGHDLADHLRALDDIHGVMSAMKNLAFAETRKLAQYLENQQRLFAGMEDMLADFLRFHPQAPQRMGEACTVYLLIGSERGFCGDFNEQLRDACAALRPQLAGTGQPAVIAVGRKLTERLEGVLPLAAHFPGPNATEEVEPVLSRLVAWLDRQRPAQGFLRLGVLHHAEDGGDGVRLSIFSPFRHPEREAPIFSNPPLLNLPPANFLVEFADHYLLAALYTMLYRSLMVENRRRLQHMDNATHRLEQRMEELRRQRNQLRQEEITNEIEVIMLGQAILDPSSPAAETDYPQDGENP
ncbi:F0F1 ATP synthase subunit gamma [Acidithiobacillus sulfuriphilus]|uniref:F0F1 ATP synthase subunit gamma n=1 Tax=Acidithiobacillus sulfuriphilus TaxID=1867749 RepID=UPI003F5FA1DF